MEIKRLLEEVQSIAKQSEELSALKGENFNVFQIFNMESDENKMHSRFINTLINPKERHGRGTIFLKLFLETIKFSDYFENLDNVSSKVEHSIGNVKIDGMKSTGGRIDIFIWDDKKSISIENKIYAGDQEKQIVRYWNHNTCSNKVFYLNLHGTEPSKESKSELMSDNNENAENPHFYCISYSETILTWLEKCQKEASDFPIIRETIKQYIITVKRITGQLINQKMNEDINKLILENYESALIVAKNIEKAKITLVNNFLHDLEDSLKSKLGDNWIIEKGDAQKQYSKLTVTHKNWMPKAAIAIQGQDFFYKNETIIGLLSPIESDTRQKLKTSLKESDLKKVETEYPNESKAWFFYKPIFNLSIDNHFSKLLSKGTKQEFKERVFEEIFDLARWLEEHLKK